MIFISKKHILPIKLKLFKIKTWKCLWKTYCQKSKLGNTQKILPQAEWQPATSLSLSLGVLFGSPRILWKTGVNNEVGTGLKLMLNVHDLKLKTIVKHFTPQTESNKRSVILISPFPILLPTTDMQGCIS